MKAIGRLAGIVATMSLFLAAQAMGQVNTSVGTVQGIGPNGSKVMTPAVSGAGMGTGAAPGSGGNEVGEPSPAQACQRWMDLAQQSLTKGNIWYAADCLRMAKGMADASQRLSLVALYTQLNTAAEPVLAAADKDYLDGKYQPALTVYQKLTMSLAGTPVGAKAKEKMTAAENDPRLKAALQEAQAAALMESVLAVLERNAKPAATAASAPAGDASPAGRGQGEGDSFKPAEQSEGDVPKPKYDIKAATIAALPPADAAYAYATIQTIAKQYPSAKAGTAAQAVIDEVRADPDLKSKLEKSQQDDAMRQKLALADSYLKAGLKPKAAELYREIVKLYPKTDAAAKAQAALDALAK